MLTWRSASAACVPNPDDDSEHPRQGDADSMESRQQVGTLCIRLQTSMWQQHTSSAGDAGRLRFRLLGCRGARLAPAAALLSPPAPLGACETINQPLRLGMLATHEIDEQRTGTACAALLSETATGRADLAVAVLFRRAIVRYAQAAAAGQQGKQGRPRMRCASFRAAASAAALRRGARDPDRCRSVIVRTTSEYRSGECHRPQCSFSSRCRAEPRRI